MLMLRMQQCGRESGVNLDPIVHLMSDPTYGNKWYEPRMKAVTDNVTIQDLQLQWKEVDPYYARHPVQFRNVRSRLEAWFDSRGYKILQ